MIWIRKRAPTFEHFSPLRTITSLSYAQGTWKWKSHSTSVQKPTLEPVQRVQWKYKMDTNKFLFEVLECWNGHEFFYEEFGV